MQSTLFHIGSICIVARLKTKLLLNLVLIVYSKTMFLCLSQVYFWGFTWNTHDNNIIKTKSNYYQKLFTTEREAPSKVGLGLGYTECLN